MSIRGIRTWVEDGVAGRNAAARWLLGVGLTAAILEFLSYLRFYSSHTLREGLIEDPLTFQLTGWYLTKGGRLYIDVWEPKPPMPYETTALFAFLSFGNMALQHVIGLAVTLLAIAGVSLLIGALILDLAGDVRASAIGGLVPFVLPAYHLTAVRGFHDKYFVTFFGLLAVYAAVKDRPLASGAAAAAAVGYVQVGAVYPLLAVGIAWDRGGRERAQRTIGAGVVTAALILAPVVAWGAVNQLLAQAILLPLIVEGGAQPMRLIAFDIVFRLGYGAVVLVLGLYGLRYLPQYREGWWVGVGVVWGIVTLLIFEFDGTNDLFILLGFLGVAVGLLAATVRPRGRQAVAGSVAVVVVISMVFPGGFGVLIGDDESIMAGLREDVEDSVEGGDGPRLDYGRANAIADGMRQPSELYWERIKPLNCWYLLPDSGDLRAWVAFVAGPNGFRLAQRRPSRESADSRRRVCHDYDLGKLARMAF